MDANRRPPAECPVCGEGHGPVRSMIEPRRAGRGILQAVWEYPCGHTYGFYAPDESRGRRSVTDLETRKAGGPKGGSKSSRRRRQRADMDRPTTLQLYHRLIHSTAPATNSCPGQRRCAAEDCQRLFSPNSNRQEYCCDTCRERVKKRRQRAG